jgi:hypothetical protein
VALQEIAVQEAAIALRDLGKKCRIVGEPSPRGWVVHASLYIAFTAASLPVGGLNRHSCPETAHEFRNSLVRKDLRVPWRDQQCRYCHIYAHGSGKPSPSPAPNPLLVWVLLVIVQLGFSVAPRS